MAKIKYEKNVYIPLEELYRIETGVRISGGFNLSTAGLPAGSYVPPCAPISVDKTTRTATLLRRVRVLETGTGETLKVSKHALLTAGVFLSNGTTTLTIDSIDTSDDVFDLITAKASTTGFTQGTILFEAVDNSSNAPKGKASFLTYAPTKVEEGATLTALAQAYEVEEDKLYIPVTKEDKTELTSRFLFL